MPKNVQPFEDYAKERGLVLRGGPCVICSLPPDARTYADGAWEMGWRGSAVAQYLTAQGFPTTEARVARHYKGSH